MRSLHNIPVEKNVVSAYILTEKFRWEDFNYDPEKSKTLVGEIPENKDDYTTDMMENNDNSEENEGLIYSQDDLDRARKKAYETGLADGKDQGFEEGLQRADEKLHPHIQLFENLIGELRQEKESFYEENELYIVKLAIEIAKKIIRRELTQNPDILLYVVREALKRIADKSRIVIRTHPEDYELIKKDQELMQNHLPVFEHVDFVTSEKIQRGGCLIESESGIVDAQLDVQLEKIEQSLLEGVNG